MGDILNPLTQFLRARNPRGERVCYAGHAQYIIPILPPGTRVVYEIGPYHNAYCAIIIWHVWSPHIVPNTIYYNTTHEGVISQAGILTAAAISEGLQTWLEVTTKSPVVTTIENVSTVAQYYEASNVSLIVMSEDDYKLIRQMIEVFGGGDRIKAK